MSVLWMVAGGVTDTGITCSTRVTNGPVRVAVDTDPEFGSPSFFGPESVDAQGVAKVALTGLDPATRYFWQVEDDGVMETPSVLLPGSAGDHVTTADRAALNITDTLDIRIDFVPDDLGSNQYVVAKYTSSAGLRAYAVRIIPGGLLNFIASEDGDVSFSISSSVAITTVHSAGTRFCVRVVFVGDNGDGDHDALFYTAATMAGPWTQLGSTVTNTGTRTLHESTEPLSVGANSAGVTPFAGRVFSVQVRHGIGGTIVAHPRFDEQAVGSSAFLDAHENTWTLGGNAEITGGHAGTFRTLPEPNGPVSFSFAASTCAGNAGSTGSPVGDVLRPTRISNHEVFSLLADRAVAEDWAFFHHGGDLHYYDLGGDSDSIPPATLTNLRRAVDDVFRQTHQANLMRSVPWSYMDDDHDWVGGNNNDGTHPARDDAIQVWRETWPTPPLGDSDPDAARYYSFKVGRVLFLVADVRADRDPNDTPQGPTKTMLGAAQKTWMAAELVASDAELVVWLMGDQWQRTSTSGDNWGAFSDEREEVAGIFDDNGYAGRVLIIQGDAHANGAATQHWSASHGIPVVQCAALDATPSGASLAAEFDGPFFNARNQYGVFHVNDQGAQIAVQVEFYSMSTLQATFSWATPEPFVPTPDFLVGTLAGTHRAVFEARALSTFQTSDDPTGVEIPVLGGDVRYDATAQVFATVSLETAGHDGRRSLFPRRAADLLAPYGHEVFVRRGIDLGDRIEWWPLGIFRIDDVEQTGDARRPLRISGSDRMASIVDARLVDPIQFGEDDTVGAAVVRLVHDVYPAATILFDDGSASQRLGRQILVEEDRYEALHDIAESLGKVLRWTESGTLLIADAPDPSHIVWAINAGWGGVLVEANRSVSRDGMRNGWVVTGEGAGEQPIRGVVVDVGPTSPTRWGGPFGRIPGFYSSPLITTSAQARRAGEQMLRRHLGMPYNVSFGSVVNPALRPRQAVRVTHRDGNRETHLVETLTVPLVADARMSGTTREQTLIDVASL